MSGVATLTLLTRLAAQTPAMAASGDARLTATFDAILAETIAETPEFATALGFDKGANARLKYRLDDNSAAAQVQSLSRAKRMVETVGFARGRSQREVERYCTMPGQACSDKIGHARWLRARANAQRIAGTKFDLRQFHEVRRGAAGDAGGDGRGAGAGDGGPRACSTIRRDASRGAGCEDNADAVLVGASPGGARFHKGEG